MKRVWIAAGLIAASLILGAIECISLNTSANIYAEMLNEADACMENNEAYQAQSLAERLDHRYSEDKRLFHIFSFHSDINAIGSDLAHPRRRRDPFPSAGEHPVKRPYYLNMNRPGIQKRRCTKQRRLLHSIICLSSCARST